MTTFWPTPPLCPQLRLYQSVLISQQVSSLLRGAGGGAGLNPLPAITSLRKICHHPQLFVSGEEEEGEEGAEKGEGEEEIRG